MRDFGDGVLAAILAFIVALVIGGLSYFAGYENGTKEGIKKTQQEVVVHGYGKYVNQATKEGQEIVFQWNETEKK